MGYAIFTARKLMLTNRIAQLNFRRMQLSQQQQTLADNAAKLERAIANTKNLFSTIGNVFQMGMTMQQNTNMMLLSQQMQNTGGDFNDPAIKAQLGNMLGSYFNGGNNFMSTGLGMTLGLMNQSIETVNASKLQHIKDLENQIELQAKSIETQLQAAQKELEAVEKQEEKECERSAPKFA